MINSEDGLVLRMLGLLNEVSVSTRIGSTIGLTLFYFLLDDLRDDFELALDFTDVADLQSSSCCLLPETMLMSLLYVYRLKSMFLS
jgi:hypothetical protein